MPARLLFCLLLALSEARAVGEVLTSIRAVRALTPEQAASALPVRLEGVVTYVDTSDTLLWIQDETEGIYIRNNDTPFALGDRITVEGVSRFGTYSPSVGAPFGEKIKVTRLGPGVLPKPIPTTLNEALTGARHDLLVTLAGVVRSVEVKRGLRGAYGLFLGISTPQGSITAKVPRIDPAREAEFRSWLNLPAQFIGVMTGTGDATKQIREIRLSIPSLEHVQLDSAGLEKIFQRPPVGFTEVLRYTPSREPSPRVQVRGVVALMRPGEGVFLAEKETALWVQTPQEFSAQVGDVLAVAGFPTSENGRISLADAIVRVAGRGSGLAPRRVTAEEASQVQAFDSLVTVEGEVTHDAQIPAHRLVTLRSGSRQFVARVLESARDPAMAFPSGTVLRVTGILESTRRDAGAKDRTFTDFELLARTDADLALLRAAPWLNAARLRWIAGALLGILALAALWVWLLGRQVRRQTRLIEHQVHQETITGERQRMARELHDTLEQQLVGVQMQLNALSYHLPEDNSQARSAIGHASAMLEHSRQETRRSVWELRSQMLEEGGLAGALRSLLQSPGGHAVPAIRIEIHGPERRLERTAELHLLRIAQEAVTNAQKHALATHIDVTLDFSAGLELRIADDGTGFDSAAPPANGTLHFGLLGMRERAGKIEATLNVHSTPGAGTVVQVTLPSA